MFSALTQSLERDRIRCSQMGSDLIGKLNSLHIKTLEKNCPKIELLIFRCDYEPCEDEFAIVTGLIYTIFRDSRIRGIAEFGTSHKCQLWQKLRKTLASLWRQWRKILGSKVLA